MLAWLMAGADYYDVDFIAGRLSHAVKSFLAVDSGSLHLCRGDLFFKAGTFLTRMPCSGSCIYYLRQLLRLCGVHGRPESNVQQVTSAHMPAIHGTHMFVG